MSVVLEIVKAYLDFGWCMTLFFFGRATKDADDVLGPALGALVLGLCWPWPVWYALKKALGSHQAASAAANYILKDGEP